VAAAQAIANITGEAPEADIHILQQWQRSRDLALRELRWPPRVRIPADPAIDSAFAQFVVERGCKACPRPQWWCDCAAGRARHWLMNEARGSI
jgi:hypothetical protein